MPSNLKCSRSGCDNPRQKGRMFCAPCLAEYGVGRVAYMTEKVKKATKRAKKKKKR
jgi:hypothetical protein